MTWLILLVVPAVVFVLGFLSSFTQSTARSTVRAITAAQLLCDDKLRAAAVSYLANHSTQKEE
jgi:hypothetical protein